jgi:hypothetical protein
MKPTQGNFAENALAFGVAGINVDGCRINVGEQPKACLAPGWDSINQSNAAVGYRPGDYQQGEAEYKPNQLGRFPANVVFSHAEGCVLKGMKKVKPAGGAQCGSKIKTRQHDFYSQGKSKEFEQEPLQLYDENGNETVEDWACVESCPVKKLDEQSGLCDASGKASGPTKGKLGTQGRFGSASGNMGESCFYGDSGGASRFFYTVKELVIHEESKDNCGGL